MNIPMTAVGFIDGQPVELERYIPEPIQKRRIKGTGSLFQRTNGLWVGRIELPSSPADRRTYREVSGRLFCHTLRKFSALERPEGRPVSPHGGATRRALLAAAQELGTHTGIEWLHQLQRQRGRCHYCERQYGMFDLTKDHMTPISRGGSDGIDNIVAACLECNLSKGAKSADEYAAYRQARYA